MTVGDVMTKAVITANPDTPIKVIGESLTQHGISGLPVVDSSGKVVGIVTEADLLLGKEAAAEERFESLAAPLRERREQTKARAEVAAQAMSSPVLTIAPDAPLAAAARVMRKHGVKRLPVVDGEQNLLGILSRHDILSALVRPDADIHREIVDGVLPIWLGIDPASIDVAVEDGIVTLSGKLDRRSAAEILCHLVHGVDGVVAVRSFLTFVWDDTEIKLKSERLLDGSL
ncbi:MAG: CBS domain-containing protein [Candidatus Dormiibacterota bacterium]